MIEGGEKLPKFSQNSTQKHNTVKEKAKSTYLKV